MEFEKPEITKLQTGKFGGCVEKVYQDHEAQQSPLSTAKSLVDREDILGWGFRTLGSYD